MTATTPQKRRRAHEPEPPQTPTTSLLKRHRNLPSEGIDAWFQQLEDRYQISLPFRKLVSPAKRPRTDAHIAVTRIQHLYFTQRKVLDDVCERLSKQSLYLKTSEQKLACLAALLEPVPPTATPPSRKGPNNEDKSANLNGKSTNGLSCKQGSSSRQSSPTLSARALPKLRVPTSQTDSPNMSHPPLLAPTSGKTSATTSFTTNSSTSYTSISTVMASRDSGSITPNTEPADTPPSSPFCDLSSSDEDELFNNLPQHALPLELSNGRLAFNEHHRVRRLPYISLFEEIKWPRMLDLSSRLEYQRAVQIGLSPKAIDSEWTSPRTLTTLHQLLAVKGLKMSRSGKTKFHDASLCAKFRWGKSKDDNILRLEMLPPRFEPSNSLQRKFGGDRFLFVDVPSLSSPPATLGLSGQGEFIQQRFLGLLRRGLDVLGCRWQYLHVQSSKTTKSSDPDFSRPGASRIIFFAVSSDTLPMTSISIVEVIDWALPLKENRQQTACKANARLDLVVSRAVATMPFSPSQVEYGVNDIRAVDVSDQTPFDDPAFSPSDFNKLFDPTDAAVMNDGCNLISKKAMCDFATNLGLNYVPSALQGRLFGAKGIWFLDPRESNEGDRGVFITLSQSQIKIVQKQANFGVNYDPECLTLNVVQYSRRSGPSVLYLDFIPILVDRGVSANAILQFAKQMVESEAKDLVETVTDVTRLRCWIYSRFLGYAQTPSKMDPPAGAQRILHMLNAGFVPADCNHLGIEIMKLVELAYTVNKKNFKIPVPRSTSVFGVADPTGTLKPGEIFLQFSEAFIDENKQMCSILQNVDVIVARNPAMRNSDIQKVRAVITPELMHLFDIVVFPSAAKRPLAGKLQGGDYDGDTFWVCWQPELVKDFKNAPAPWTLPDPTSCAIEVHGETLGEVLGINDGSAPLEKKVVDWQIDQAKRRLAYNPLGMVTLAHGKLVYHENRISSEAATALVDLHDHLVDADKQGFQFDQTRWEELTDNPSINQGHPTPAYRQYLNFDPIKSNDKDKCTMQSLRKSYKKSNILHRLIFECVDPTIAAAINSATEALRIDKTDSRNHRDPALAIFFEGTFKRLRSDEAKNELYGLKTKLRDLQQCWSDAMSQYHQGRSSFALGVSKCREFFDSITPSNPENSIVNEWMHGVGSGWTTWDLLKASAAASLFAGYSNGNMILHILAPELCVLKARSLGQTVEMTPEAFLEMKPRPPRRGLVVDQDEDEWDMVDSDNDGESDYGWDDWSEVDELDMDHLAVR